MEHVVSHLVRRGVEAHASYRASGGGSEPIKLSGSSAALVMGTMIFFMILIAAFGYTYGDVVATLAMVESPTAALYEPLPSTETDATLNKTSSPDPEILLVSQKPVTDKLRTALRRLTEHGGRLARFRGLSIYVIYNFVLMRLAEVLSKITPIPLAVSTVLATVLLSRYRTAWVHIVISEPSPKYWFKRIPPWKTWMKVALPTAVLSICEQITIALPVGLGLALGLGRISDPQQIADMPVRERCMIAAYFGVVILLGIFSAVAIIIPAQVALTRVQASLISEEEETIVPFDRTFGGRVVPEILGGSGCVGMLDAWKTFDWNARVRLLKLYVKVFAVQTALTVLMAMVVIGELRLIMGDDFTKFVRTRHASIANVVVPV